MRGFRLLFAAFALLGFGLTGCSTLMQGAPLPEGFEVKKVAKADAGAPFSVSRTGTVAAVSKGSVRLTEGGVTRTIAEGAATEVSFSPSGEKLAVVLPAEKKSVLRLFDRQGKGIAETTIPMTVTGIAWKSDEAVVATAVAFKKYSFGSHLTTFLYQWDGAADPASARMSEVTIRPNLANLPEEQLFANFNMALSPYGDEIAYSSLKDPPLFTPYQRVAIRHLESGNERDVAVTALGSGGPVFLPDGESILVGNTHGMTREIAVPEPKEIGAWPSPGKYPALSPSGSYLFLDGRLYQGDRTVIQFPTKSRAQFLPDGSGLAVSHDGKLYLVTGLNDPATPALPADTAKLLQLRRLRSMGLITEQEFRVQKEGAKK